MIFGTVIRMKKNETFITQSMLSSYMAVESKDYLELLLPFVSVCLPQKVDEVINISKMQEALKQNYSLDIPVNVVEKLLTRLCKKKRDAIVKKVPTGFAINKVYDTKDFEEKSEKIKRCIDAVLSKMQRFMINQKHLTGVSYDKMKEYLTIFLDTYNYAVYEDAQSLDTVILERYF